MEAALAGLGASEWMAKSMAKTKLMMTKRILMTHGSQSLISPEKIIVRPKLENRNSKLAPGFASFEFRSSSLDASTRQFSDQGEQREIHGNDHAADHHAQDEYDHRL